ncbi:MAG TPA: NAD-dependent epimerase/dehydratase family protein [Vicinamibacteria bacterium]|nr:NAD-dependent epimerase/dehydratase family protein [Vicinamibacteria bacterium]
MRALVTGAAGFVGAVLARRLAKDGHEVHALVRPSSDLWRLEGVEARIHPIDLAEEPAVGDVVDRVRPEWIFHLAAHGAYPSQSDFRAMVRTNVLGTIHLVESCLRIGFDALVNTGSSSEYGFTDHAPSEDEEPRPSTDYAVTKLTATLYCRAAAARSGHSIPTLRLYSVYGPHEEPSRFVPQLAVRGLEGKLPPLVSPDVARDFVFVDDVIDAYLAAARRRGPEPGAVYNVGTGRQTSIREAVEVARRALSIDSVPQWGTMPNRAWDTSVWIANPKKIERELGWRPRTTFEEGFSRFARWLSENPDRLQVYRDRAASNLSRLSQSRR